MMMKFILQILVITIGSIDGAVLPGHNERRTVVQESGAYCTLKMARQHFAIGSTTAITQSGLPSQVHFNGALSSYTMMLTTFMAALHWTVVVDQASTYEGQVRCFF